MQDITVCYYVNIRQIWTTQLATFDAVWVGGILFRLCTFVYAWWWQNI